MSPLVKKTCASMSGIPGVSRQVGAGREQSEKSVEVNEQTPCQLNLEQKKKINVS
jgi:hypothetical protein